MTFFIFTAIIVCLTGLQMVVPYLVKKTIVFGVVIPEEHLKDEKLLSYKKRYSSFLFIFTLIALIFYVVWFYMKTPAEDIVALVGMIIQFAVIFLSIVLYFNFHVHIRKRKSEKGWGADFKQVKVTDLSVRSQDAVLPWYIFVLPMIVTIGLIAYTGFQYQLLPDQIPTHWGANGKPDAFTDKNPFTAISLLLVTLVMQLMFLGINEGKRNSGIKLSPSSPDASRNRQLTLRKNTSIFMLFTSVAVTILMSFLQLATIHENMVGDTVMMIVPMIFLFVILLGVIVLAVKVGKSDTHIEGHSGGQIADYESDAYWKGGLFYFNRNDPSIFVEKRFGVGWTLNFANPIGYVICIGPIVLILLIAIFS